MKSLTEHLTFNLPARMAFRNITSEVEQLVARSGIREGLCLVNAMHITASVFINDDEPGLHEDYARWLERRPAGLSPQSHRRRQRRRASQAAGDGPRGRGGGDGRQTRLRPLGADLLRRVRRPPSETGAGQGDRGVTDLRINPGRGRGRPCYLDGVGNWLYTRRASRPSGRRKRASGEMARATFLPPAPRIVLLARNPPLD